MFLQLVEMEDQIVFDYQCAGQHHSISLGKLLCLDSGMQHNATPVSADASPWINIGYGPAFQELTYKNGVTLLE